MANNLAVTDAPVTGFSMQSLTPSALIVLARAHDPEAVYSAADIALIEPVSRSVAVVQPATERTIRQSVGSLAASLPSQASDANAGVLKMNSYIRMLSGCDKRALAYACERCLAELDWMPTIHQLLERIEKWASDEQVAISRARAILRVGKREPVAMSDEVPPELIRTMKPEHRAMGIRLGFLTQEQIDAALGEGQRVAA